MKQLFVILEGMFTVPSVTCCNINFTSLLTLLTLLDSAVRISRHISFAALFDLSFAVVLFCFLKLFINKVKLD